MASLIDYGSLVKVKQIPGEKNIQGDLVELEEYPPITQYPIKNVIGYYPICFTKLFYREITIGVETLCIYYIITYSEEGLEIKLPESVGIELPTSLKVCPRYKATNDVFTHILRNELFYCFEATKYFKIAFEDEGYDEIAALCVFCWKTGNLTSTKLLQNISKLDANFLFQHFEWALNGIGPTGFEMLDPSPLLDLFLEIQYCMNVNASYLNYLQAQSENVNIIDHLLDVLKIQENTNTGVQRQTLLGDGFHQTEELKQLFSFLKPYVFTGVTNEAANAQTLPPASAQQYPSLTNDFIYCRLSFRDIYFMNYMYKHKLNIPLSRLINCFSFYSSLTKDDTFYAALLKKTDPAFFSEKGFLPAIDSISKVPSFILPYLRDTDYNSQMNAMNYLIDSLLEKKIAVRGTSEKKRLPVQIIRKGASFPLEKELPLVILIEVKSDFFKDWLETISNQDYQIAGQATDPPELLIYNKLTHEIIPTNTIVQVEVDKLFEFEACHWLRDVYEALYGNEYYAAESIQNLTQDQGYYLNKGYLAKLQQQKLFVSADTFKVGNKLRIPISEIQSMYYIPVLKKDIRQGNATTNSYATNAPALAGTPYTLRITTDLPIDTPGYYNLDAYVTYTKDSKTYKQEIAGFLGPFFENGTMYEMYHFLSVEVTAAKWPYATFQCEDVETSYLKLLRYRDSWTPFFLNSFRDAKEKEEAQQTMLRTFQFSEKRVNPTPENYEKSLQFQFTKEFLGEINAEEGIFLNMTETMQEQKNCNWFVIDIYSFDLESDNPIGRHLESDNTRIERYRLTYTLDPLENTWSYQMYQTQRGISKRIPVNPTILERMIVHMPLFSNSLKDVTLEDSTSLGEAKYQLAMDGSEYLQLAMITQTMISAIAPHMSLAQNNVLLHYEDANYVKKYLSPQCFQPLQSISYPLITSYTFGSSFPSILEVYFFNQSGRGIFRTSSLQAKDFIFMHFENTYYENHFNESIAREWNFLCSLYKTYSTLDKETYFTFLPNYRKLVNDFQSRSKLEESILRDLRSLAKTPNAIQTKYKVNLPKAFEQININAKERAGVSTLDRKVILYLRKMQYEINQMRSSQSIGVPQGFADIDARVKMLVDKYWRKEWKDFAAVEAFAKQEFTRTQREIQAELDRRAEEKRKKEEARIAKEKADEEARIAKEKADEAARLAEEKRMKQNTINTKISDLETYKTNQVRASLEGYNQGRINALIGPYKNKTTTKDALTKKFTPNLAEKYDDVLANLEKNKQRFTTQLNVEKKAYQKQKNELAAKIQAEFDAFKDQIRPSLMYLLFLESQLKYIYEYPQKYDRERYRNILRDKSNASAQAEKLLEKATSKQALAIQFETLKETYRKRKIATYAAAKCDLYSNRVDLPTYESITDDNIQNDGFSTNLKYTRIYKLLNNPIAQKDLDLGIDYVARNYCYVDSRMIPQKRNYKIRENQRRKEEEEDRREAAVQKQLDEMTLEKAREICKSERARRGASPSRLDRRIVEQACKMKDEQDEKERKASVRYGFVRHRNPETGEYNTFTLEPQETSKPFIMGMTIPNGVLARLRPQQEQTPWVSTEGYEEPPTPQGLGSAISGFAGSALSGIGSFAKTAATAAVVRGRSLVSGSQQEEPQQEQNNSSLYSQLPKKTSRGRAGSPGRGRGGGKQKTRKVKKQKLKGLLKKRKSRGHR